MADNTTYTPAASGAGIITIGVDNCTVNAVANVGIPLGKVGFGGNDVWTYVTSSVGLPGNLVQVGGSAIAIGKSAAAASLPVVLPNEQIGTAGTAATSVLSVQGIASMTPVQVSQATGTNLHAVIDSGTLTTVSTVTAVTTVSTVTTVASVTAITNALPAGTNTIGSTAPIRSTLTDGSGTITAGGTSQQVFAVNATRSYLLIQNTGTGNLWINFTTAAVQSQPSLQLTPGSSFVMESRALTTEAVNIIGATTGQAFTAKQL